MRIILAAIAATALMTGAALADPMAAFYDNTVEVTGADGATRSVHINADGTYSQAAGDTTVEGTWEMTSDSEACFSSDATAETGPYCVEATARSVGDTWELTAPDGSAEAAVLIAGR